MPPNIIEEVTKGSQQIKDKGIQLANLLRPTDFGIITGNPHTLAEWLIYIVALPITLPISFLVLAARWVVVETRMVIWHILGMIGVEKVTPLINSICNNLGPNNPLYPLFDMFRNPDSEFGASIIDQAVGGAVAMGVNRVLDPLMRPVGFALEENLTNQELPEPVYTSGVKKGVISWENYIQGMKRYGYNPEMADKYFRATKLAPGVFEVLNMLNRGIIDDATAETWLLLNDFTADINAKLKELRWYVPTAQDVVQFAVREAYTPSIVQKYGHDQEFPGEALKDAQAAGLSPDKFKLYWISHWRYPSPEQIYTMLHRGVVDSGVVAEYLKMQDYSPYWREKMAAISYTPFTRVDVRRMYKTGTLNESEVTQSYKDIGYTDEKAAKLTDFTVKYTSTNEKMLSASIILTGYKDSLITRENAEQLIKLIGYSDYDTTLQLGLADFQKKAAILSSVEQLAKTEFQEGVSSLESSMNLLREYGVNEERIMVLSELWPLQIKHTVKTLSESDLRKAYALGLISADEFRNGLISKNYSDDSADIIVSLENLQLEPTRVGGVPPGITTTGVIKTFTKAELKKMLINELIDANEWAYQMSLLGYSEEQIYLYGEMILTEIRAKEAS